jgi:hypothetical protein
MRLQSVDIGSTFTGSDWDLVRTRADATAAQLRAKGATADDFRPLPPVPESQLVDFNRQTGFSLPGDFAGLVTKYVGGWWFDWTMWRRDSDDRLRPPVRFGDRGGNAEVSFIGVTAKTTLLQLYEELRFEVRMRADDPSIVDGIRVLFPLHLFDGGGDDFTVLRLDVSATRIYYLDHEYGWMADDQHMRGLGFREFVLAWSNLGFPACEPYELWVNPETRTPDDSSPKAEIWRKWLADPHAG